MNRKTKKDNESRLVNACCDYLKLKGVFYWRQNNHSIYDPNRQIFRGMPKHAMKGVPDIICVLENGRFVGIEVKLPGGSLSRDQRWFHENCPGRCFVVKNLEDLERVFLILTEKVG